MFMLDAHCWMLLSVCICAIDNGAAFLESLADAGWAAPWGGDPTESTKSTI